MAKLKEKARASENAPSPEQRRSPTAVIISGFAIIGAFASVAQLVGFFARSGSVALLWSAAITGAAATLFGGGTVLWYRADLGRRIGLVWRRQLTVATALILVVAASAAGVAGGLLINHAGSKGTISGPQTSNPPSPAPSGPQPGSSAPDHPSPGGRSSANTPTRPEIADNRAGTKVFADTNGTSVGADVPAVIPFGQTVQVRCKVPNTSGMGSVSYWYLIDTPPWQGKYAPSDTFANGDPVGQAGSHNVDAAVPDC